MKESEFSGGIRTYTDGGQALGSRSMTLTTYVHKDYLQVVEKDKGLAIASYLSILSATNIYEEANITNAYKLNILRYIDNNGPFPKYQSKYFYRS